MGVPPFFRKGQGKEDQGIDQKLTKIDENSVKLLKTDYLVTTMDKSGESRLPPTQNLCNTHEIVGRRIGSEYLGYVELA